MNILPILTYREKPFLKEILFLFLKTHTKGFTLIELLIIMAIIAVIALLVLVAIDPSEILKKSKDSSSINAS